MRLIPILVSMLGLGGMNVRSDKLDDHFNYEAVQQAVVTYTQVSKEPSVRRAINYLRDY